MTGVETLDADRHDGVEKAYEIDLIDKHLCLIYGFIEWGVRCRTFSHYHLHRIQIDQGFKRGCKACP